MRTRLFLTGIALAAFFAVAMGMDAGTVEAGWNACSSAGEWGGRARVCWPE